MIGHLALAYDLVTEAQLEQCLAQQRASNPPRRLGEVMVELKLLTPATLQTLLSIQTHRRALADPGSRRIGTSLAEGALDIAAFMEFQGSIGAEELVLAAGTRPYLRRHGRLVEIDYAPLEVRGTQAMLEGVLAPRQKAQLDAAGGTELTLTPADRAPCQAQIYRHNEGLAARLVALEPIDEVTTGMLPKPVWRVPELRNGLVLVCGPRDSGTTQTVAGALSLLAADRPLHIVTVEPGRGRRLEHGRGRVTQHLRSELPDAAPKMLSELLREDPDVLVFERIQRPDEVEAALIAASSRLVLATLYTPDVVRTIRRLVHAAPADERPRLRRQIAQTLRIVICQRLVPRADHERRQLAYESLVVGPEIVELLAADEVEAIGRAMAEGGRDAGMLGLDECLAELVKAGRIARPEAVRHARSPEHLVQLIGH